MSEGNAPKVRTLTLFTRARVPTCVVLLSSKGSECIGARPPFEATYRELLSSPSGPSTRTVHLVSKPTRPVESDTLSQVDSYSNGTFMATSEEGLFLPPPKHLASICDRRTGIDRESMLSE